MAQRHPRRKTIKLCSFDGCDRKYYGKGYCATHLKQYHKGNGLKPIKVPVKNPNRGYNRVVNGHKKCGICRETKPVQDYHKQGTSITSYCRWCYRTTVSLKSKYGLTKEGYENLLALQGGCCQICRVPEQSNRRLSVDHDHSCCPGRTTCGNCIRGLLCDTCNSAIGLLKDDLAIVKSAVTYLEDWKCSNGTS